MTQDERQELAQELRERHGVTAGTTVYTILRYVSPNGMRRRISCMIIRDGKPLCIDYVVARITGRSLSTDGGIICHGVGMDIGHELVYILGRRLYPDGFTLAENQHGRNGDESRFDNDGGYALNQAWF